MGFIKNVGIAFACTGLLGTGAMAEDARRFVGQDVEVLKGERRLDAPGPKGRQLRIDRGGLIKATPIPEPPNKQFEAGPQPEPPTRDERALRGKGKRARKPLSVQPHAGPSSARGGSASKKGAPVLAVGGRAKADPARGSGGAGGCVDPVAESITVSGVRANGDGTYDFSLRGTVVNRGSSDWHSRPGQQAAHLSQGANLRAVARFPSLAAGARVNTSFARVERWLPSQEFQQGFELRISYDPDIFIDGNERNDDCQLRNNQTSISVAEINREIDRQAR